MAPSAGGKPPGLEHASSDDLILKQVLASSLRDRKAVQQPILSAAKVEARRVSFTYQELAQSPLAMREQMELSGLLRELEEYERQQVFASLDSEVGSRLNGYGSNR